MQACKLIMFHYACTHVRSGVWSGSAAKGVLRKRAQIGAPVRKGTPLCTDCFEDQKKRADLSEPISITSLIGNSVTASDAKKDGGYTYM